MNCFGFGTTFSPPVVLDVISLINQHRFSHSADAAAHQASDSTAHQYSSDRTLDYGDVAAHQASDNTVCAQNPDRILATDAAAAQQASDDTAHGQNPDRTLLSGALPEAKGLEPSAVHHAVTSIKPTPSPTGGTTGEYPQGGAGRGGLKAAASLTSGTPPQREQLSKQALCNGHAQSQELSKGLAVARLKAKAAKDALKGLGWLDRSCRADTDPSSGVICLPLTDSGSALLQSDDFSSAQFESDPAMAAHPSSPQLSSAQLSSAQASSARLSSDGLSSALRSMTAQLNRADAGTVQNSSSCSTLSMASSQPLPTGELPVTNGSLARLKGSTAGPKSRKQKTVGSQEADRACLQALMQAGLAVVRPVATSKSSRAEGGPAQRLKGAVTVLLQQHVSLTLNLASICWHQFAGIGLLYYSVIHHLYDTVTVQQYCVLVACSSPWCSRVWVQQLDMDSGLLCCEDSQCCKVFYRPSPTDSCCMHLYSGLNCVHQVHESWCLACMCL